MTKRIDWLSIFKKSLPFVLIVVASLLSCFVYFLPGLASGDDLAFHISMTNDLLYGFEHGYFGYSTNHLHMGGFAIFNYAFYGPVLHYGAAIFVSIFKWAGATPTVGLKFMIMAGGITGGIFMYLLALKISKNNTPIALIASILFVFLPYRIFCALARCALAESFAMALIPMVFYGAYSFVHDEEYRVHPYVVFAIGAILIVLSHAFTGLVTATFGFIYLLFNIKAIVKRRKNYAAIISFAGALVASVFCVLFYVVNSYYYESTGIYNISNAERQWTTYEHMAQETSRSYDFSGFINFTVIKNWQGQSFWDDETISSLIFSSALYFIGMIIAIALDLSLYRFKYSKFYRHPVAVLGALLLPLIFKVRIEIFFALAVSLVLYFFISYLIRTLPESNEETKLYRNVDLYFLTISLLICIILLFVPESWKLVPPIFYQGQFAWRMWSITAFLFAMLITYLLYGVKNKKPALISMGIVACSLMTITMGTLEKRVYYAKQPQNVVVNDGYEFAKSIKYSGAQNEMIPQVFYQNGYASEYADSLYIVVKNRIYNKKDYIYDKESYIDPVFLKGTGTIEIVEYNSPNNTFHVNITSENALIQFPQFYYTNYTAYSNGKSLGKAVNIDGLIAFNLQSGEYDVKLQFKPCDGYQATVPLFYVGTALIIGGGVFGYIYRKKLLKKPEPEQEENKE